MVRACSVAEKAGFPATGLIAGGFVPTAKVIARALGIPDLPIATYPGVIMTDTSEAFHSKVAGPMTAVVESGLVSDTRIPVGLISPTATDEPNRDQDIVFRGDLDAVQEWFVDKGWSDGLPIMPPTVDRVMAFLKFSDRDPSEVIGTLPPEQRRATVWNTAVNGVMAGCRPEYFPLLLAIVEILATPEFRLEDAGATPGWEPLVTVSGPISRDLDFNSGSGVLRVGRQANTSVGRFVRLFIRNVAAFRIPPGTSDKATFGTTFHVALAENEDEVRAMGWPTYGNDRGFGSADSVVTVQSVLNISGPIGSFGTRAEEHLEVIAERFKDAMGPRCWTGLVFQRFHPMLLLSPSIARVLAADGMSKDDVRTYLREHTLMEAALIEKAVRQGGRRDLDIYKLARDGAIPPEYGLSDDANRLIPMCVRTEWIQLVVAGDPDRNQSRAIINNHAQGPPVSRKVNLPIGWDGLLRTRV